MTQATAAAQLAQPFGSVPALVRVHAAHQPAKPAVVCGGETLSYATLDRLVDRAAASLQRDGAKPGGAVAICAAASARYVALYLAAVRAGCAAVPLAPGGTPEQLATMVADSGAGLLFLDAAAEVGPVAAPRVAIDDGGHATGWSDWLMPPGSAPQPVEPDPDAAFNIIYSSGTTGTPKGIVQSQRMRWRQQQIAERVGFADAVTLIATPLYSNTTLVSLLPTLAWGGTVALLPKFDAAAYLDLAEATRATHTMLVPVQYRRLMEEPSFDARDLSAFRYKTCTSAPFPAELKRQVLNRWPGKLVEYYGLTEGGGSTILIADEFPDKLHTVGRPAPGHDIRLIDADGREVAQGEVGEVVGRSPVMMSGYHGLDAKTRETLWHDAQGNAFIRHGDVGRFDADGFLTLTDRTKDLIISGGFNLYPADLEAALMVDPDVVEASVIGVPSDRWGETPVAFVVLSGGDADAVRERANDRLGKTQRLHAVIAVDELPRSEIGKVLKRELRESWSAMSDEPAVTEAV